MVHTSPNSTIVELVRLVGRQIVRHVVMMSGWCWFVVGFRLVAQLAVDLLCADSVDFCRPTVFYNKSTSGVWSVTLRVQVALRSGARTFTGVRCRHVWTSTSADRTSRRLVVMRSSVLEWESRYVPCTAFGLVCPDTLFSFHISASSIFSCFTNLLWMSKVSTVAGHLPISCELVRSKYYLPVFLVGRITGLSVRPSVCLAHTSIIIIIIVVIMTYL